MPRGSIFTNLHKDIQAEDSVEDPLDFQTPDCKLFAALTRRPRDFTITTDSYISLCSQVYAATCFKHTNFADEISESAFLYYAVLILWKRFTNILPISATSGSAFFKEIACLYSLPSIPLPLLSYLKGIGHFSDMYGADRRFVLPVIPCDDIIGGVRYTFGKVSAKTHFYYEAFPAPAIVVLRILADMAYTKNVCEKNLIWDLPEGLRPDVLEAKVESSRPTKNLLGWAPAKILTKNQMQLLESLKVDNVQNDFSIVDDGLSRLLNKIHSYFEDWDESMIGDISGALRISVPPFGSIVQGVTVKKQDEFFKFDRSAMYCEGSVCACSPYDLSDHLIKGALIAAYRMQKEPIGKRHYWACYDFDEYKSVPESWIRSRNTIYTYGHTTGLNETFFSTSQMTKKVLQNNSIQHTMFKSNTTWNIYM